MRTDTVSVYTMTALAIALACAIPAGAQQPAPAQKPAAAPTAPAAPAPAAPAAGGAKTLKMQSSWPASLTLQDNFKFFAERVDKLTSGQVKIDALAAGQVV